MFDIHEELKKLPQKPGVYIMKDENAVIIYVGKAVNLRNRVRQYFQASSMHDPKVMAMSPRIKEFEYIVVDTELEALILECNLIKKYWPKYNIKLKDDKSYSYLKLTVHERFPRLFTVRAYDLERDRDKNKARYFGPYTSVSALSNFLELIHTLWPLRRCDKNLSKNVKNRERPCLNYHIGKCKAPCNSLISEEEYNAMVDEAVRFINGKHDHILDKLSQDMREYSDNMEFEKAAELRDRIDAVKKLSMEQKINKYHDSDQDVIAFARAHGEALVQVFFLRGGKMTGREHFMLTGVENMSREEVMTEFVKQFYGDTTLIPKELILETDINDREVITKRLVQTKGQNVIITVPQRGDKLSLVKMAANNAVITLEQFGEQLKREARRTTGALEEIKEALNINILLNRIEAYDISNTSGSDSVGSMVVFENGKSKNSDYRKFKIKSIIGPNDYASMEEVITRRLNRYKNELNDPGGKFNHLPDIIFVDGGKPQISAAEKVVSDMELSIPVCGMVKDDRHRTKGLLHLGREVSLPKNSEGFRLITRIQDEVHRFALEYHRKLRSDSQTKSVLDDIPMVGPARRKALLKHFGAIDKIRRAEVSELAEVETMNTKAAEAVYSFFRK